MVHRDPTFAGRTRRQCASPTAGINGRSSPSRANRIREYRKPSTGSRFRKTERNGTSDGAWGWPYPHGAPDADGVACALLDRGCCRRARSEIDLEFHHSLCSRFSSPACRSGCRPDGAAFCSSDFHLHRNHIWARSSFPGNESRYDCRNSGRCSRLRLQR